ncbi:MlaE family lipid ABC transporter permease subunit [bacterium]|nr:MlaE family lipid ABC transporter permease subunit [bacterium]
MRPEASVSRRQNRLVFRGQIVIATVPFLLSETEVIEPVRGGALTLDLAGVDHVDTAGVAFLDALRSRIEKNGLECRIENAGERNARTLEVFSSRKFDSQAPVRPPGRENIFEKLGGRAMRIFGNLHQFFLLLADTFYYAIIGLFNRRGMRKGDFINQSILIGMNSLPIVGLISFLIGFILALQSAAQLRQFGAAIFVADLIAIAMTREMGPLITAIVLAGRSGSAITAEIATMMVTEETDALRSMALNPVRYVVVPKVYAITMTMPMLTILSMLIGIFGAMVIGLVYLDIGMEPFYREVVNALILKDILTGFIKSVVFAWLIVMIGAYYGFQVRTGAEEVGRATTASVVASIFWVILADSLLGLAFYLGQPVFV